MGNEGFNNVILTEGGVLCRETTATLNPSNDVLMRRLSRLSRSTPAEPLPDTLAADLRSIVAPNPRRRPAAVRTLKGEFLPRVVFVSADEAVTWHLPVWKRFIRTSEIHAIESSPDQIPADLAAVLWQTNETSMGSLEFVATMRDGKRFAFVYSGPNDFILLPAPLKPSDTQNIATGRGISKGFSTIGDEPDFVWCAYR